MTKRILFACVGNAFRSQIAEAWARHLAEPGSIEVRSGGTAPASAVHARLGILLREKGIAVEGARPKPIDLEFAEQADFFITLCGPLDAACPARIARKAVDWNVDDPSWSSEGEMRRVRDLIGGRVLQLLKRLDVAREGAEDDL